MDEEPLPDEAMVSFLLLLSVVRVMPEPATKVSVSELEPAVILFCPETAIVLKISWLEPVSELVMVSPSSEIPEPAVRDKSPVLF